MTLSAINRHDGDKPVAALNSNLMLVDHLANIGQIASHQRQRCLGSATILDGTSIAPATYFTRLDTSLKHTGTTSGVAAGLADGLGLRA
jgi:hypothetical protein